MMLSWSGSSCVMCRHSSVDLVSETFVSTPTLQVTLEKLQRVVPVVNKFDVNRVFKEITSRGGSYFCWPCLAALHGGMSVVSQINRLEQRLKKFAGCIGRRLTCLEEIVGDGTHHQGMEGNFIVVEEVSKSSVWPKSKGLEGHIDSERTEECLTTDTDLDNVPQQPHRKLRKLSKGRREVSLSTRRKLSTTPSTVPQVNRPTTRGNYNSSLPSKAPGIPIPSKKSEECLTTDTDLEESSQDPRRTLRNRSKGRREVTSRRNKTTNPSTGPPVSPSTLKSGPSLPSKAPRIPGVENCPSCDFSVDVRTPLQAKSSTKPVPYKTLEAWRKSSRHKLALHYRDYHMPSESKVVQHTKEGIKLYSCPQCPYKSVQSSKAAVHYFSIHVLDKKKAPSQLSCPIQGCSYSVDVPVRRGIFKFRTPQRHLKEAIATHVLKEHDFQFSVIHKTAHSVYKLKNSGTPLFIETSDNQKEYRCTRCDLVTHLPETLDNIKRTEYRRNFLGHFYDCHLNSVFF